MFGYHGVYQSADKTVIPKILPLTDAEWQKKAAGRISRIRKMEKAEKWDATVPEDWQSFPLNGYPTFVNNLVFFSFVVAIALVVAFFLWIRR